MWGQSLQGAPVALLCCSVLATNVSVLRGRAVPHTLLAPLILPAGKHKALLCLSLARLLGQSCLSALPSGSLFLMTDSKCPQAVLLGGQAGCAYLEEFRYKCLEQCDAKFPVLLSHLSAGSSALLLQQLCFPLVPQLWPSHRAGSRWPSRAGGWQPLSLHLTCSGLLVGVLLREVAAPE